MGEFERRLWSELITRHGALLADPVPRLVAVPPPPASPPRGRRRRRALLLAAFAAVPCAVLLAADPGRDGSGPAAAYSVARNADGSLTVTIRSLLGVDGANAHLAAVGVPVRVVRIAPRCRLLRGGWHAERISPERWPLLAAPRPGAGGGSIRIWPGSIPAGDTLVVGVRRLSPGAVGMTEGLYRGGRPTCLPT